MLKARLTQLGRETINKLIEEGISLDPDQIVCIHELAKKAASGLLDPTLLLMTSRKVGNVNIYPLTIGSKVWLDTVIKDYFQNDGTLISLAILYAHAHARQPEILNFDDPIKCKKDIIKWARKNNITEDEFNEVINSLTHYIPKNTSLDLLLDLTEQIREHPLQLDVSKIYEYYDELEYMEDSKEDCIPGLALLMRFYGETKEHWLWEESEEVCAALIKEGIEKETGKKSDQGDPAIIAFQELHIFCNKLRADYKRSKL
jgi:hypothetical protein